MSKIYRISFRNGADIYELYANEVSSASLYGFVQLEGIIFKGSEILVDPALERLKAEFKGVNRTFIPFHSVVRIDEVEEEGNPRILPTDKAPNLIMLPKP